ncbi:MAG: alpha/beta fold hydrolase [Sphingomonas sp.]|nr:alpha/beta fold hydrolase [Sphingomonas sp.]
MAKTPRGGLWMVIAGLILAIGGAYWASSVQTSGGVSVRDIRFVGTGGKTMSALLYMPPGATPKAKAPGILAVHGYINSRETQDAFAIEFARRGYVVLAIDQRGHGYSDGPAYADGFGGPDGLKYLRSLPMVDTANIGLEGHSMGGWTVLAAAAAMPDAYEAVVLEGSSTGKPFAKEGSPTWPRNLGLVYSQYDEFSKLMWGVDKARDIGTSAKLKAVFGTTETIQPRNLYGSIADGTARVLATPAVTHPGDHISPEAVARAIDWFSVTLKGAKPIPSADQIWVGKEIGTGLGLIGFALVVLGVFDLLLGASAFAGLRAEPVAGSVQRDGKWRTAFLQTAFVPMLTFFPCFIAVFLLVQPNPVLPQTVSTQVALWLLVGAAISSWIGRGTRVAPQSGWGPSIAIAVISTAAGYALLALVDRLFVTDFRLWVVAIKLPSVQQLTIAAIYIVPITFGFVAAMRTLTGRLTVKGDGWVAQYGWAKAAMVLGMVVLLAVDYGVFFATGQLPTAFDPLTTVIAIQFILLLPVIAAIAIFTWRRTGSHRPGAMPPRQPASLS